MEENQQEQQQEQKKQALAEKRKKLLELQSEIDMLEGREGKLHKSDQGDVSQSTKKEENQIGQAGTQNVQSNELAVWEKVIASQIEQKVQQAKQNVDQEKVQQAEQRVDKEKETSKKQQQVQEQQSELQQAVERNKSFFQFARSKAVQVQSKQITPFKIKTKDLINKSPFQMKLRSQEKSSSKEKSPDEILIYESTPEDEKKQQYQAEQKTSQQIETQQKETQKNKSETIKQAKISKPEEDKFNTIQKQQAQKLEQQNKDKQEQQKQQQQQQFQQQQQQIQQTEQGTSKDEERRFINELLGVSNSISFDSVQKNQQVKQSQQIKFGQPKYIDVEAQNKKRQLEMNEHRQQLQFLTLQKQKQQEIEKEKRRLEELQELEREKQQARKDAEDYHKRLLLDKPLGATGASGSTDNLNSVYDKLWDFLNGRNLHRKNDFVHINCEASTHSYVQDLCELKVRNNKFHRAEGSQEKLENVNWQIKKIIDILFTILYGIPELYTDTT